MAEEIVLNVSVNGDASIREVKDLKKQFAEAEDAVFKLAGAGKRNTDEFRKAALEAAALKQEVDNINTSLDDLKPEAKLAAFGKVSAGIASGFAAATGAAALFGDESEDLQKTLVKVQAAMAFADGIRGLKDLSEGFKVLKTIILANPIFLISTVLIAIGTALFALKDKISFVGDAFSGLGKIFDFVIEKIKMFTDWLGVSDFKAEEVKENTIKRNEELIASNDKRYDKEIRAASRAGKATEALEIAKAKAAIEANTAIIANLDARVDEEKERIEELKAANEEFGEVILDLEAARTKRLKEEHTQRLADEKEALDKRRELQEFEDKDLKLSKDDIDPLVAKYFEQTAALKEELEKRRIAQEEDSLIRLGLEEEAAIREAEKKFSELEDEQGFKDLLLSIEQDFEAQRGEIAQAAKDKSDALKEAEIQELKVKQQEEFKIQQEKFQAVQNLSNAFFAIKLSNAKKGSEEELKIAKQQFKINKGLQIAQATINGLQSVTAILSTPDPSLGVVTAIRIASAAAATAATIAKIGATKFDGGGSPSISAPAAQSAPDLSSGQNVSQPAVQLNKVGSTSLNPDGTVKQDNDKQPVVKAYVVETDITGNQKNIKDIEEKATFS